MISFLIYFLYYLIIGAIIAVASWMYFSSYWKKHNREDYPILAYLPICMFLWPLLIVSLIYKVYNYFIYDTWDC